MKNNSFLYLLFLICSQSSYAGSILFDDFNRTDGPIGNNWVATSGNLGGDLSISNNRVTHLTKVGGGGGITRNYDFSSATRIQAVITDMVANNDRESRFGSRFSVLGDGSFNSGYGVSFSRSRDGLNNSNIAVYDGTTSIGTIFTNFQFLSSLVVDFTINTDGSILGSVSENTNVDNFYFGAYAYASSGDQFIYQQSYQDPRASFIKNTTLDDLEISNQNNVVPIANSLSLICIMLPILAFKVTRRLA